MLYAKWNKSLRERQIPYDLFYMWEKKKRERDGNKLPKQPHREENRLMEPIDEIRDGE